MTGVLDFVSPGAAVDAGGFHPVARSPLDRRFRDAGATFADRDGWAVPVSAPGEREHLAAVGVADLSHLTKLEVRPAHAPPDLVTERYKAWYAISPRRALVLCEAGSADEIRRGLDDRFVLDVTAQHAIVAIVGPEAGTVIRRLTHLHHFPSGGEVAHITAHVLVPSALTGRTSPAPAGAGSDEYWIVCAQEYGHYLSEVALDRAAALGGGLVGVDALGGTA